MIFRTGVHALAAVAMPAMALSVAAPLAAPATGHAFAASCRGTGAVGRAAATGSGKLIGPGTLRGSARGQLTSPTCVVVSGTAVLEGTAGSITLSARNAPACAVGAGLGSVAFSGRAQVVAGTETFTGAHGTLSFSGTYVRPGSVVTIKFKSRVSY